MASTEKKGSEFLKLRFQLIDSLPGAPPRACQLPEHYSLEVASDREVCVHCGGTLRRVRTSTHYPLGLLLGRPRVRLIHKACAACRQADALEAYYQYVPPGGNYAYDLIVDVGLARCATIGKMRKSNVISSNAGDGFHLLRALVRWPIPSSTAWRLSIGYTFRRCARLAEDGVTPCTSMARVSPGPR